jgi:uncharacterized membrane protein YdjX (TVP38/TMEM64 family)
MLPFFPARVITLMNLGFLEYVLIIFLLGIILWVILFVFPYLYIIKGDFLKVLLKHKIYTLIVLVLIGMGLYYYWLKKKEEVRKQREQIEYFKKHPYII